MPGSSHGMRRSGRATTETGSAFLVDPVARRAEHHAVVALCALRCDEAVLHVGKHERGIALERVAEPAAARALDPDDVPSTEHDPGELGGRHRSERLAEV